MPDLGLAGPTHRYALIVTMLVGLAAVPTAIALGAAQAAVDGSGGPPGSTPLLGLGPGARVAVIPDATPPASPAPTGGSAENGATSVGAPSARPKPHPTKPHPTKPHPITPPRRCHHHKHHKHHHHRVRAHRHQHRG